MTETGIGHSTPPVLTKIPIIPIIDAGTASLSPFQQTTKIVHDHAGLGIHVRLESAFTMRWKPRSRSAGICTHMAQQLLSGNLREVMCRKGLGLHTAIFLVRLHQIGGATGKCGFQTGCAVSVPGAESRARASGYVLPRSNIRDTRITPSQESSLSLSATNQVALSRRTNPSLHPGLEFVRATGCRSGEAAKIELDWVRRDKGYVDLPRREARRDNRAAFCSMAHW